MANREFISPKDVEKELTFIERLLGELSSEDEYLEAILRNQKVVGMLALSIMESEGIEGGLKDRERTGGEDETQFDNLPNGHVGVSLDNMSAGESGNSIFKVEGSYIHASVDASSEINRGDAVEVMGPENTIRPLAGVEIEDIGVGIDEPKEPYYDLYISDVIEPSSAPGDVVVEYVVTNTGGVTGSQDIVLRSGSKIVDSRDSVSISPGDGVTGSLSFTIEPSSQYNLSIETDDESSEFSVGAGEPSGAQYLVDITGVS